MGGGIHKLRVSLLGRVPRINLDFGTCGFVLGHLCREVTMFSPWGIYKEDFSAYNSVFGPPFMDLTI